MNYVFVNSKWFAKENNLFSQYGSIGLSAYVVILRSLTVRGYYKFTLNDIYNSLKISKNNTRLIKNVKEVLFKLNNDKYIKFFKDDKLSIESELIKFDNNSMIYCSIEQPNNFFKLYDNEVNIILEYGSKQSINTFDLLAQFIFLSSLFGNKENSDNYKICYPSHEYIANSLKSTASTVMNYNVILANLDLLIYNNSVINTVTGYNTTCVYSRYGDNMWLNKGVQVYRKIIESAILTSEEVKLKNTQRSLKQKLNILYKKFGSVDNMNRNEYVKINELEQRYLNLVMQRGKKLDGKLKFWTI